MIVCENSAMKRILLVKTSSLGDVIHNLPVISDILKHNQNILIDWVVEESFADIPKLHPAINQVFTVAVRRWRKRIFSKNTWQEIAEFKKQISQQPYDLIIDTQGLIKSAVMTTFAQGTRCGLDKSSAREPLASFFYNKKFSVAKGQHAVVRNRELVANAFNYAKPDDAPCYDLSAEKINACVALPEKFIMGLHGTSKDSKLWSTDQWIALADKLSDNACHLVLPWASNAEHQRALKIANNRNHVVVLPKLSILELSGIISHAWAAIGVDTGLSHLSVALNIPTIAIYTDTNPTRTGVMASAEGQAINLGGVKQNPSVTEVLDAIRSVTNN
jgi:heptosyltransferase I